MALASVSDLKKYMDITFSNTQEEAALMIITGLEADLEHDIGRPVTAASFSETYVFELGAPPEHQKNESESDAETKLDFRAFLDHCWSSKGLILR